MGCWKECATQHRKNTLALPIVLLCLCVCYTRQVTFSGNTASSGSLFNLVDSILNVNGPVCAQNNSFPAGSFINLGGNSILNLLATLNVDAGDISVSSSARVYCNDFSWVANKHYNVTGEVCQCNEAFIEGKATTCNSCSALGWDYATCACAVVSGKFAQHRASCCGAAIPAMYVCLDLSWGTAHGPVV